MSPGVPWCIFGALSSVMSGTLFDDVNASCMGKLINLCGLCASLALSSLASFVDI